MPVTLRPVAELAGAQRASFASFLLLGHLVLCSIAWVPEYIDRLGVSFAQWGVILGLAPIGALSAVITAPFMINRFGTSPVMRVTALLATVALVPLGFVTNAPLWTVLNTLFNFLAGLTGVAVIPTECFFKKRSESQFSADYTLDGASELLLRPHQEELRHS